MLSLSLSLSRNCLIAAFLALSASPAWAQLAADETFTGENTQGSITQIREFRVDVYKYNGATHMFEPAANKQDIPMPHLNSTQLYLNYYQHTYGVTIDGLNDPTGLYCNQVEIKDLSGAWTPYRNTGQYNPGNPSDP